MQNKCRYNGAPCLYGRVFPNHPPSSESKPKDIVGKGCATLFFGIFGLAGLLVFGGMTVGIWRTVQPYFWQKTPCTIVESRHASDTLEATTKTDTPYVIRYRYEAGGKTRESDKLTISMESPKAKDIERLLFKYPAGEQAACYVNSSDPDKAVLQRGSLWPAFFMLIPMVFMGVGAGGIIGIWRGKQVKAAIERKSDSKTMGTVTAVFFFGLFTLVGGILTMVIVGGPLMKYFAAKNWPETPCEIVSSGVGSHSGSKGGTTYSVDITYRYKVRGRETQSDTYSIMSGSSSGRSSKEGVVARYPVGMQTVCYVNPEDPTDALLSRELTPWLLIGLLPGTFLLVGVSGLVSTARSSLRGFLNRSATPILPGASSAVISSPLPAFSGGPEVLNPQYSPLAKLGGVILIALIWNGIVGVFVWFVVGTIRDGKPEWFPIIFLIPFVLIGLFLIGAVVSSFLNLFNPRVRLTVNSRTVPLGGRLDASWAFTSSASRIQRFKLILEGREETTRGSGKERQTERKVFATLPLIDTTDPRQIAEGRASLELPDDQRRSDDEGSRKVIWALKASGEIPRYPDFEEEYEVTVVAREVR